jgi:SagB-type dehydrogenase family enzyme
MEKTNYENIFHYHEETKHHFNRFARSMGYLDWKTQPNPFRFYEGITPVALPFLTQDPEADHRGLYERSSNSSQLFTLKTIAAFLELSLGLSAWKAINGSSWSLRINPSSGNLHPTESHLYVPPVDSLQSQIYHYNPFTHSLEPRAEIPESLWLKITEHFKSKGFLILLSSIFWRESWKYGERAFRYCNHDVGHALACLSFSANLQGWKVTYLNALSDSDLEHISGFHKIQWKELEKEEPDLLCFVYPHEVQDIPRTLPSHIITALSELSFKGTPNQLSREQVNWKIIYQAAHYTEKPQTEEKRYDFDDKPFYQETWSRFSASTIIRKRRSAVNFDIEGSITKEQFFALLDKTLPRSGHPPFDTELIVPSINLLLFVHSVKGLKQGLYFFVRNEKDFHDLKNSSHSEFLWEIVEKGFPLYFLNEGNFRKIAMKVSCDQEIAGLSSFSLGMIARFKDIVKKEPYRYRHLFWESGMIGQVLYLEAEAQGVRGTGIGCFFDNPVHEILGVKDNSFQSLYHFTVGHPIEDERLTSYPPYHHLKDKEDR